MQKRFLGRALVLIAMLVAPAAATLPQFETKSGSVWESAVRDVLSAHVEADNRSFTYTRNGKSYQATLSVSLVGAVLPKSVDKAEAIRFLKGAPDSLKPVIFKLLIGCSLDFFASSVETDPKKLKGKKLPQPSANCPFRPGMDIKPLLQRMYAKRCFDFSSLKFMLSHRSYFVFKNASYETLFSYLAGVKTDQRKLENVRISDIGVNRISLPQSATIRMRPGGNDTKQTYDVKIGNQKATLTLSTEVPRKMNSKSKKGSKSKKHSKSKKGSKSKKHSKSKKKA